MSKKTLRRALIASVVSLVLCFAMLLGATYAWFTDTASTGVNTIASGNLKMVLEYWDAKTSAWKTVDSETKIFDDGFEFEPGAMQYAYLRIRNDGSLAFKCKYNIIMNDIATGVNVAGESFKLSDYLDVSYFPVGTSDTPPTLTRAELKTQMAAATGAPNELPIEAGESSPIVAIVIYMDEEVGNEANHNGTQPQVAFGITAVATQYTSEEDAFDDQYDVSAEYPLATLVVLPAGTIDAKDGFASDPVNVPYDTGVILLANNITAGEHAEDICDFVLTFNKDVDGSKVAIYGEYQDTGVIGAYLNGIQFTANNGVNVMETLFTAMTGSPFKVPYEMVVGMQQFNCYLHVKEPVDGLIATLELVMFDSNDQKTVIETYTYEFPSTQTNP